MTRLKPDATSVPIEPRATWMRLPWPGRTLSGEPTERPASGPFVAGVLLYLLLASVAFKGARAVAMTLDADSLQPLYLLPAALCPDLLVVAAGGLASLALARVTGPRLRWLLGVPALATFGGWLAVNFMSYRLTGAPLTWQTVLGDQGATMEDVTLLGRSDATVAYASMTAAAFAAPLALWLGPRLPPFPALARPRWLLAFGVLATLLFATERAWDPQTYGLDENPIAIFGASLLDAVDERRDEEEVHLSSEEWADLHQPLLPDRHPNRTPETGGPAPRNVIVFVAEGIPYDLTSFGAPEDPTPNLRRRAEQHGILFDRFYSNWHSSIQALFALACSEYPTTDVDYRTIVTLNPHIDCGELSEVLRDGDKRAGLFHGGHFAFYDKLGFFGGRGYTSTQDAAALAERYPDRAKNNWGIDDRAVVQGTLDWIDSLPEGQGFGALLIPITAHYPFWVPPDFERPFGGEDDRERFLDAVAFQDAAFEELARGLEERGLYDDTLLVWLADHGNVVEKVPRPTPGVRTFYQANLHVPLVLLNPRLFPERSDPERSDDAEPLRVSHRTGSLVDLVPTILDTLELPPDPRHRGQSLLSSDYRPRRLFFGAFRSRKTYVGLIEGDHKVVLRPDNGHMEYYDLARDPQERNDLAEEHPRWMRLWKQDLSTFYEGMLTWIPSRPKLGDREGMHAVVLRRADVRLERSTGGEITCKPGESVKRRICPGIRKPVMEETVVRVGRHRPRCLLVRTPATATRIVIELRGEPLERISGVRFGTARQGRSKSGLVQARGYVDGQLATERTMGAGAALRSEPLSTPSRSFRVELTPTEGSPPEVCLVLSDAAWRNKDI